MQAIVAFSHLRWDFAWQRPQQLLSRLGRRWPVVYIEEPVPDAAGDRLEIVDAAPGVQVWRPHVTSNAPGFNDENLPALRKLVAAAIRERGVGDFWAWLHTPMALPIARALNPRGLVYDCTDELSHLTGTQKQLVQRENALFKVADLVFTGGRSIHNAKRHRHPDVHCFAPSVDAKHFAGATGEHPLHADIPHPRLGYSGVIDERINLDLIDAIATARPEWNVVMTGPVDRIAAASLPRRDNIHWLVPQGYDELPRFLKGWDVGLLPYALNDATRALAPSEPLEYMACGLAAVSTSIRDVVEPYGHLIRIADTPEGFIADCEMIMARTREEKERHARELAAAVAAATSWDDAAHEMAELIAQADDLADSAEFMKPQPSPAEVDAVPPYLASPAHI
jgi:glycosyltransferase involved in cell wall biosynthesis